MWVWEDKCHQDPSESLYLVWLTGCKALSDLISFPKVRSDIVEFSLSQRWTKCIISLHAITNDWCLTEDKFSQAFHEVRILGCEILIIFFFSRKPKILHVSGDPFLRLWLVSQICSLLLWKYSICQVLKVLFSESNYWVSKVSGVFSCL